MLAKRVRRKILLTILTLVARDRLGVPLRDVITLLAIKPNVSSKMVLALFIWALRNLHPEMTII